MKRNLAVLLLLAVVAILFASPQRSSAQKPTPSQAAPAEPQPPPPPTVAKEKEKVQGYTLTPEQYKKAVEYSRARYQLYFFGVVYGLLALWLVLRLRLSARYRDWAERASRVRLAQAAVFLPPLALTLALLTLPPDMYGQWLLLKYEQSVQSWSSWLLDWAKAQFISIFISIFLVWILYAAMRRSPQRWWF